jgi:hypothetical protein
MEGPQSKSTVPDTKVRPLRVVWVWAHRVENIESTHIIKNIIVLFIYILSLLTSLTKNISNLCIFSIVLLLPAQKTSTNILLFWITLFNGV